MIWRRLEQGGVFSSIKHSEENMHHQYKLNGYNIVLDTCSGAVHLVDDVAYDAIALYKEKPRAEIVAQLLQKYAGV